MKAGFIISNEWQKRPGFIIDKISPNKTTNNRSKMKTEVLETNRLEKVVTNGHDKDIRREVSVKAPNFQNALFDIKGTARLVIKRFSEKDKFIIAYEEGTKKAKGKKVHAASSLDDVFNKSRYVSPQGWDGFHAGSIRNALIRVCTLVDLKMTLAKMSLFVKEDGYDQAEPQIPLVRIYGDAIRQDDIARLPNGTTVLTTRAAYHNWTAKLHIRWDADQFSLQDVTNLLMRVGVQCGIGEGRPFSKNSTGMGWGTFDIIKTHQ